MRTEQEIRDRLAYLDEQCRTWSAEVAVRSVGSPRWEILVRYVQDADRACRALRWVLADEAGV